MNAHLKLAAPFTSRLRSKAARQALRLANHLLDLAARWLAPTQAEHPACDAPARVVWPSDAAIEVTAGTLWITIEGAPDDHTLMAGERLPLRPGRVVWIGRAPPLARDPATSLAAPAVTARWRISP
jgi:hypothetical protein